MDISIILIIVFSVGALSLVIRFMFKKTDKSKTISKQNGNVVGGDQAGRDVNKK